MAILSKVTVAGIGLAANVIVRSVAGGLQQPNKVNPAPAEAADSRMAHAFTYLMNAVFVLMTTNYTLNPGHYFLGGSQTTGS